MLTASSLLTSAAWQTAPIHSASPSAQPVPSGNGAASTAQPANVPAASSSEHTASDNAQQRDATGAEASHRWVRRAATRAQDSANAADGQTAAVPAGAAPLPFQAVLNDVLPRVEEQQGQRQTVDSATGQELAKATGLADRSEQAAHKIVPDASFQITRQSTAAGAGDLNQRLAEGEVAFSASIAQRAGLQASVDLRDSQTVISESRFDTARQATDGNTDAQAALAAKKSDAATTQQANGTTDQNAQPATESQLTGDANSNANGGGQDDADAASMAAGLRAASESEEADAAMQPVQHAVTAASGVPAATADGGVRSPGTARVSAETSTPQIPEPQGETTARAGDSVREISLRLSNADQGAVQVRLSERAGELHVTVRTPDTGLTRGLRDGLPDLMGRLQVNGYRAETWQPGGNSSHGGQDQGQDARGNSQQRNGGGNPQQNSQQQQQQQDEQTPQWVREMESSIQRSNSAWPASPVR